MAEVLKKLGFNMGIIQLTEHKDLNDFFQAGKTFDDFAQLLVEPEIPSLPPGYGVAETETGLVITCEARQYRIRGVSLHNLERLRVNIRATHGDKYHIDTMDLYQSKSRHYLTAQLAKFFNLEPGFIEGDLFFIINQIEAYQDKQQAKTKDEKKPYQMSKQEEEDALNLSKSPDLFENILRDMDALGHVGEETNKGSWLT